MVINEARRLLAEHSFKLMRNVESGKIGPEHIGRFVLFKVGGYVAKASPDRTTTILVHRAIGAKIDIPTTHSELLGYKLSNLLTTTIDRLDPEERRGVLFYTVGDSKQHGLAVLGLELLGESSAVEVTTKLIGWRGQYLEELEKQDLMVRARVDSLPLGIRRLAMSSIDEAALCLSVGDQRSAMGWLRQVRRLVARFGTKELPRSSPDPRPPTPDPRVRQLPMRREG